MRHVYEIFCLILSSSILSCAPTMKDFSKLDNDLRSSDQMTRKRAAQELGKIKNADSIVSDSLVNCGLSDDSSFVRSACVRSLFRSVALNKIKDKIYQ